MPKKPGPEKSRDRVKARGKLSAGDGKHRLSELSGLSAEQGRKVRRRLARLYPNQDIDRCFTALDQLIGEYKNEQGGESNRSAAPEQRLSEKDVALITYGDLIEAPGRESLRTLGDFTRVFFEGLITILHVLPFFPYSSDRGFAVIDYLEVDRSLGTWADIDELNQSFRLMFDAVFNHVSSHSQWFQDFLLDRPEVRDHFIYFEQADELDEEQRRAILRPRTHDLLTSFDTPEGKRYVWTTFSADQVDLNFRSPEVLVRVIEVMLFYVRRGAEFLRLDAVTYLWYELGTSCAHLKETHEVVKLFRDVLDATAPQVMLITETNVPHADNVTYFGNGWDEAQLVYSFALPPLVLHAFQVASASTLTAWAQTLEAPSPATTFFNFLDSHDGIGLMGARDVLTSDEIDAMCLKVREHGGMVSMRDDGEGRHSPYELNITWFSALNREDAKEPLALQLDRFMASRAIALVLQGVPAVYLPSFFGARNDLEVVQRQRSQRDINRATIREYDLLSQLQNPDSVSHRIAKRFIQLLERRVAERSFHPNAPQRVLVIDERLFTVVRSTGDGCECVVCLTNVTGLEVKVALPLAELGLKGGTMQDVLSGYDYASDQGRLHLTMRPYQVAWLKAPSGTD